MLKTLLILFLFVFSTQYIIGQKSVKEIIKNIEEFNEQDSSIFNFPDKDYRFFIQGEYHFQKDNSDLFLKTFTNLYFHENVRIIFMESGLSNTIILNNYLENGDEESLSHAMDNFQFNESVYTDLKSFYDTLPEGEKFKFIGVDLEIYEADSKFLFAANLLAGENEIPDSIVELINEFENDNYYYNTEVAQKSFDKIYFDWKRNKDDYIELMGKL